MYFGSGSTGDGGEFGPILRRSATVMKSCKRIKIATLAKQEKPNQKQRKLLLPHESSLCNSKMDDAFKFSKWDLTNNLSVM